jgi:hypothetical protein
MGLSMTASVGGPVDRVYTLLGASSDERRASVQLRDARGPAVDLAPVLRPRGATSTTSSVDHVGTQGLPILRNERALGEG